MMSSFEMQGSSLASWLKERGKRWKMILYTSAISPIYKKQGHVRDNGKFDLTLL